MHEREPARHHTCCLFVNRNTPTIMFDHGPSWFKFGHIVSMNNDGVGMGMIIGTQVRLLCDAGADHDKATVDGVTALYAASQEGHLEVVRLLCDAGADKDKGTVHGVTALFAAGQNGHTEVMRLLCNAGADKDKATIHGVTAWHVASQQAQQGHLEALHLLCSAGRSPGSHPC